METSALEGIGFHTLSDERAANVTPSSRLQRCELVLTSRCNFKCPYCRGMLAQDKGDMTYEDASYVVTEWARHGLKNIRFSGGEPTLWQGLYDLVSLAQNLGVERIALSTNGSADMAVYERLLRCGVNDFSISLDSCCAATGNRMAGGLPVWDRVTANIKRLAELTYVTVGVVLTDDNQHELQGIIDFASSLGVADIRIIPAAQKAKTHEGLTEAAVLSKHPILKYRVTNFFSGKSVRGMTAADNPQCPLVLDDMVVMNGKHYPCVIYMREHGEAIGRFSRGIEAVREQRHQWFKSHNCYADPICRNNCLDVCVAYNNRVAEFNNF